MLYNNLKKGIYILHENPEWIPPFRAAFERAGVEFGEIILTSGSIDLDSIDSIESSPLSGVFWSRLSASSHTRGNAHSKEYGRALLSALESRNIESKAQNPVRVVNASHVLELEVSKVRQHLALKNAGFIVPRTIAVFGKGDLLSAAERISQGGKEPFITKHNQGGKGLGVRRFESLSEFGEYIESSEFEPPADDITLLQEYVRARAMFITRLEFIGGRFFYAVRVDTSGGAFELCPADACNIEDIKPQLAGAACEIGSNDKFSLREDINADTPLVVRLEGFLRAQNIDIAGIEFMEDTQGRQVVYDINTNTNYNSAVENALRSQGKPCAADRVVEFLTNELHKL
ncbi:alpha-L-glutamate ligase [Helicobacter jaachi]|uniref:Alpha-L-glutamate ligase n=1 Tax=Helicobacter jaachi TaxID=1677920 RepID=A0A4U8T9D4_9HELI|nr:alpha-L-glutamate ligase [Helicobacter jaachi]TLD96369.1 alpha-L-glutamate ligase [Helicobacter jaachi]